MRRCYKSNLFYLYRKLGFVNQMRRQQDYRKRPNVYFMRDEEKIPAVDTSFLFNYRNPHYQLYRPSENRWYPYISEKMESGIW